MHLLIYRYVAGETSLRLSRAESEIGYWQPGFFRLKPPNKGWKYSLYSFYHWFRVFRNKEYCALFAMENGEQKASMLVVPAHFRWPFMKDNDVQFTYVWTAPSARRKGWAEYLLHQGIRRFSREGRHIWYVTDSDNAASQRLAEKTGFGLIGTAKPRRFRWSPTNLTDEVQGELK